MPIPGRNGWLEQLIQQLYESVLDDEGWSAALRTISILTSSPQASVVVLDAQSQALAIHESFGTFPEVVAAYNAHYHLVDEALSWVHSLALGGWYLDRRDLGEHAIQRSAYYQEYFLRCDMATTLCNRLVDDGHTHAFLSLQRRPGQAHYTSAELAAFGQFIPHMQRAIRLRRHMQRLTERAELASAALDSLRTPLLVLDEQGHILLANAQAESLLQRLPQLAISQGCLRPHGLRTDQFAHLLRCACGRHGPAIAGGATMLNPQGRPALQLLVLPLPARMQVLGHDARPLALLVPHWPNQVHSIQPRLLQQFYGLTPAETRLALALCQGDTPEQAARHLDISLGTARIQLKAVFAKMDIHRQADLARILAGLGAVR